jgi:hypothetical protein
MVTVMEAAVVMGRRAGREVPFRGLYLRGPKALRVRARPRCSL